MKLMRLLKIGDEEEQKDLENGIQSGSTQNIASVPLLIVLFCKLLRKVTKLKV